MNVLLEWQLQNQSPDEYGKEFPMRNRISLCCCDVLVSTPVGDHLPYNAGGLCRSKSYSCFVKKNLEHDHKYSLSSFATFNFPSSAGQEERGGCSAVLSACSPTQCLYTWGTPTALQSPLWLSCTWNPQNKQSRSTSVHLAVISPKMSHQPLMGRPRNVFL